MSNQSVVCIAFLAAVVGLSFQASTPSDPYYIAGVVEFAPAAANQSSLSQLNDNLRGYLEILQSAEANATDIIVFPELTLNNILQLTYVPDPRANITPCNNNHYADFLQELSCAARDVKKYVVVNLLEKENCTSESQAAKNDSRPCASNGMSSFNTNVVFNRDGVVVSRYRKFHIYGESVNVTHEPELSTFDTDFGVKFGQFICFDINFYSPAIDLVKMGVKDMIYTAFWYSELPFLTAVQLQQSWAYANEVNLLAAGASYPTRGTTGSGIYAGKQGSLISVMATRPERKLYVANVTKAIHWQRYQRIANETKRKETTRNLDGIQLMREYCMDAFTSQVLEYQGTSDVSTQVCHGNFCCNFSLRLRKLSPPDGTSSYKYHMAAYDGDRQYSGHGYTKYRFCSVYACTNSSLESCGKVFADGINVSSELAFESISIEGDFPKAEKVLIMPNSLDQELYPLGVDSFEFNITDDKNSHHVSTKLLKNSDNLLTFGIYANYFDEKSSSSSVSSSVLTAMLGLFFVMFVYKISFL